MLFFPIIMCYSLYSRITPADTHIGSYDSCLIVYTNRHFSYSVAFTRRWCRWLQLRVRNSYIYTGQLRGSSKIYYYTIKITPVKSCLYCAYI